MSKPIIDFGYVWSHAAGRRTFMCLGISFLCLFYTLYVVSMTRSLILTTSVWLNMFSIFAIFTTIIAIGVSPTPTEDYTFGFVRAPVLAVFATTVLATLAAVLQLKEAIEGLIAPDHHHGPGHGVVSAAVENHHFYSACIATSISLFLAAHGVPNQAFQHVLTVSQSSSLQEHATDVAYAFCTIFPGASRFLLPRINALSLLAIVSNICCILTHWFMDRFEWFDPVATIVMSAAIFSTMHPLTYYTGMIVLQTTPSHIHNQIDRSLSQATGIDGVLELKNAHFWQLDFSTIAGTVDVRVVREADEQQILAAVTEKLSSAIGVLTIQVVKDTDTWSGILNPPVGIPHAHSHAEVLYHNH